MLVLYLIFFNVEIREGRIRIHFLIYLRMEERGQEGWQEPPDTVEAAQESKTGLHSPPTVPTLDKPRGRARAGRLEGAE